MGYRNLQECVADLEKVGQLRRIDVPVDPYLELAHIQRRAFRSKSPALLFTRVKGCSFPMLANLFGTTERLHYIFRDSLAGVEAVFTEGISLPLCERLDNLHLTSRFEKVELHRSFDSV